MSRNPGKGQKEGQENHGREPREEPEGQYQPGKIERVMVDLFLAVSRSCNPFGLHVFSPGSLLINHTSIVRANLLFPKMVYH